MTAARTVGLLYESLGDLDRAVAGLNPEELTTPHGGGSSFAWTAGHVTQMFESWILNRFMGLPRHPIFGDPGFGIGNNGANRDWPTLMSAIDEVHTLARPFLDSLNDTDLARTVPYDGSIAFLRSEGLNLEYALLRVAAHHFVHASEIVTVRSGMGRAVEDYRDWGRLLLG